MPIAVHPDVVARLASFETVNLMVRSPVPVHRVVAAMQAVKEDIWSPHPSWEAVGLYPKYVSAVVPVPGGALMAVDFAHPAAGLEPTVPHLLTHRLVEVGVDDAEIVVPGSRAELYRAVEEAGPSARALLRGSLGPPLGTAWHRPSTWLEMAASWLRGEHHDAAELAGRVGSVEVPLTHETLQPVMGAIVKADGRASLFSTDLASSLAGAAVSFRNGGTPEVKLTAAGRDWNGSDVTLRMRRQRDLIRANAGSLAWAGVTAQRDAGSWFSTFWHDPEGAPARPGIDVLCDILVPDAMWYQLLSPGHLDRLGGAGAGAVQVAPERFELTIGEPEQWLPGHPYRETVRTLAREVLAGCQVTAAEAMAMTRQRTQRVRP